MANITIDGKAYAVKDGITIIEAIDQQKMDLPRYCYHPGLSIAGNCRICQVEVEKMPRTVIACNTRVAEGMVIHTQSAKAQESQKAVLEFLLANHPLDCPVCDQAGECKLQDYYMDYGVYDPRFDENKVKKTKKAIPVGPTIMLDQERCILCSRCVRFGDEITKTHDFGIFNRGDHSEIDIAPGKELNNKYSGNVADICPVGALTDRDFRFKMRVWYLGSKPSVCPGCARGCNINVEYEKSRPYGSSEVRVQRLKPRENPEVNKWWMCDEGRYAYKSIDAGRLKGIGLSRGGRLEAGTWDDALYAAAPFLNDSKKKAASWALIASPQYTNEELFLLKRIFMGQLGWTRFGFRSEFDQGVEDDFLIKKDKNPNTKGLIEIFELGAASDDILPVLDKARTGSLEGLVVFGRDLAQYGRGVLTDVRSKVRTIIYEGTAQNETSDAADYVWPSAVYAEKDGTFTNFEGRVQRIKKVLEPLGASRATWRILTELGGLVGAPLVYKKPEEIFNDLAKEIPAFEGMSYAGLEPYGQILRRSAPQDDGRGRGYG